MLGSLDQIPKSTENIEFGYNKKIKHNGDKKDGPSHLMNGNSYGNVRDNGIIVGVLAIATA
jgi:hypothetical protein